MSYRFSASTCVPAPGKVLLTGGYLVLDRNYTGTVFALDARIHVIVQQLRQARQKVSPVSKLGSGDQAAAGWEAQGNIAGDRPGVDTIAVRSPQFTNAVWEYCIERFENGGGVRVNQKSSSPRNPFVETALSYALTYIGYVTSSQNFGSLLVTILADNDYYSETTFSRYSISRSGFISFGVPLHDANKTGLGSSAALVTALVSGLVIHRLLHTDSLENNRDKLHNLAQAAHCAAQGKVGSGFDVAAAVYGSCLYRRFSPAILEDLGDVGSKGFEGRLFVVVEDLNSEHPWDTECVDFGMRLPRGMQMVLCDVECGSQTPSMVNRVLEWRRQNQKEADILWSALQTNNERLRLELKRLAQSPDTDTPNDYSEVRMYIQRTRNHLRTMTRKSGVPIEPMVQTELLDAAMQIEGVVGGVVPGAGGYDAIVLLIQDHATVLNKLNTLFENWESKVEDDFEGKTGRVRLLDVRHGSEGVRNETTEKYKGWI